MIFEFGSLVLSFLVSTIDDGEQNLAFKRGYDAVQSMQGCFLVDYNYVETESLKEGYERDKRIYDVNREKSIKEWIYAESITPSRIRLQHILFEVSANGIVNEKSLLKHHAEDWEFNAEFLYDFVSPGHWDVRKLDRTTDLWTRRITNLDDGLRYQCAAAWSLRSAIPDWTCENYAPIPGRETRDMKRKDYNALQRKTRILVYGSNWLERQENTKIIDKDGTKTPLANEAGRNWYVRLPDSDCDAAKDFVISRKPFWDLLREAWDEVLTGERSFTEIPGPPRFLKMMEIEGRYLSQDLSIPEIRQSAKSEIFDLINKSQQ